MLIGFTFQNFWSFYGKNAFSMVASPDKEFYDFNVVNIKQFDLLKSAFLFGANASGKTNFIRAIEWMKAIIGSDFSLQSKLIGAINTYAFVENAQGRPVLFEVDFIYDDFVYQYGFEILNGEVSSEYLYDITKRKTTIFKRTSPDCKDIKFPSAAMDNVKDFAKNTRRDNLFLLWAIWGNNDIAMRVYNWFFDILIFSKNDTSTLLTTTISYIDENKDGIENVLRFIQKADPTIVAIDIETIPKNGENATNGRSDLSARLRTSRYLYNDNYEAVKSVRFPHGGFDSAGTKKMFEIAGPILNALENGSVVFIDEIDARLHPMLVRFLVMMFNSIHQNPNNAQLICNTHDVLLLDENIRRDQIYFTEKDEYGVSTLYSLSDFKGVRKEDKFLKRYLLDVYGATPKFSETFSIPQKKATDNG